MDRVDRKTFHAQPLDRKLNMLFQMIDADGEKREIHVNGGRFAVNFNHLNGLNGRLALTIKCENENKSEVDLQVDLLPFVLSLLACNAN